MTAVASGCSVRGGHDREAPQASDRRSRPGIRLLIEPDLDWVLGLVVAVCVSGADEYCGALVVAVHHGDGGQATEAFEHRGAYDHVPAEPQFLAERKAVSI